MVKKCKYKKRKNNIISKFCEYVMKQHIRIKLLSFQYQTRCFIHSLFVSYLFDEKLKKESNR